MIMSFFNHRYMISFYQITIVSSLCGRSSNVLKTYHFYNIGIGIQYPYVRSSISAIDSDNNNRLSQIINIVWLHQICKEKNVRLQIFIEVVIYNVHYPTASQERLQLPPSCQNQSLHNTRMLRKVWHIFNDASFYYYIQNQNRNRNPELQRRRFSWALTGTQNSRLPISVEEAWRWINFTRRMNRLWYLAHENKRKGKENWLGSQVIEQGSYIHSLWQKKCSPEKISQWAVCCQFLTALAMISSNSRTFSTNVPQWKYMEHWSAQTKSSSIKTYSEENSECIYSVLEKRCADAISNSSIQVLATCFQL